ncbi:basic salivary proline-rich protein 3-like [Bos indicus x Bos taurus]|uniref:basic salivary proline-rich protein 3-like n=1 Tax=Bos indicus x Bos taurus TaxID=30522 RepID=UPI000F7D2182|nr:basic salivary proline-rich protein 3-like [Bos indicus x Bos taurus]
MFGSASKPPGQIASPGGHLLFAAARCQGALSLHIHPNPKPQQTELPGSKGEKNLTFPTLKRCDDEKTPLPTNGPDGSNFRGGILHFVFSAASAARSPGVGHRLLTAPSGEPTAGARPPRPGPPARGAQAEGPGRGPRAPAPAPEGAPAGARGPPPPPPPLEGGSSRGRDGGDNSPAPASPPGAGGGGPALLRLQQPRAAAAAAAASRLPSASPPSLRLPQQPLPPLPPPPPPLGPAPRHVTAPRDPARLAGAAPRPASRPRATPSHPPTARDPRPDR